MTNFDRETAAFNEYYRVRGEKPTVDLDQLSEEFAEEVWNTLRGDTTEVTIVVTVKRNGDFLIEQQFKLEGEMT